MSRTNEETYRPVPEHSRVWLIFFSFSSWLILFLLLTEQVHLRLLAGFGVSESDTVREIRVLLENPKEKATKEKKEKVFLSDRDAMARGQLTREKGFEALSRDYKLSLGQQTPGGDGGRQSHKILQDKKVTGNKTAFSKEGEKGTHKAQQASNTQMRIPSYYQFRDRFALSWDARGNPQIPTKNFEHYTYFRRMLDKIQQHWAPPGGIPYPTFGDEYHRMSFTPGYTRYTSFPSQDVKVVFMLNKAGDVVDVKLWESLGYTSLDHSCTESIVRSKNFGPPPEELLENDALIVPMIFRIVVR